MPAKQVVRLFDAFAFQSGTIVNFDKPNRLVCVQPPPER
jgi:hypothetical protein